MRAALGCPCVCVCGCGCRCVPGIGPLARIMVLNDYDDVVGLFVLCGSYM